MSDEQVYKELKEIKESVKKIQRYLFWNSFWNWVKVGVIIITIALGFLYLPQFLQDLRQMLIDIIPR